MQSTFAGRITKVEICDAIPKSFSRRKVLTASLPLLFTLMTPVAKATSPLKQAPSPIEDLIPGITLLIARGRLVRHVFRTQALEQKLVDGEKIDASELRLFDVGEFDGKGPRSSFLEVIHNKPIWARPDAIGLPAYSGLVYYWGLNTEMENIELEKLMGKECIFLISSLDGLTANGPTETFPFPLYSKVSSGHWRESLPLPITELARVQAIAKRSGFVKPKNIINANQKK